MDESMIVEVVKTLRELMVEAGDSDIALDGTDGYAVRILSNGIQLCKDTENGFVEELFLLKM